MKKILAVVVALTQMPVFASQRWADNGDNLFRTTNVPNEQNFTVCGWARRQVDRGAFSLLYSSYSGAGTAFVFMGTNSNGDSLVVGTTGPSVSSTIITLTNGQWFFWAMTGTTAGAGSLIGYARLPGEKTLTTQSMTGVSFAEGNINIGNKTATSNLWFNGDIRAVKIYDRVLSAAELLNESERTVPVSTWALNSWYPLNQIADQLVDYSGMGQTLTLAGALTNADEPPIGW